MRKGQFSFIQFHGEPGVTKPCLQAIVRLIHFGDTVEKAALLSSDNIHCFLLTINYGERVAIKSGFSSGYGGEGPRGLAIALQVLERHGAEIEEYTVPNEIIEAIDASGLKMRQLERLDSLRPLRPSRWFDYVYAIEGDRAYEETHLRLNDLFPPTLPFKLLDPRITDLALSFRDNPDGALLTAYRRLEDVVRKKAGLEGEGSARLFSKAFQGDAPILVWDNLDSWEHKARANLFDSIYRAYRNPRSHKEANTCDIDAAREFLLVNELFQLEARSSKHEGAP